MSAQRQGIVDVGRALVDDIARLVRLEIALAKQEIMAMVLTDVKALAFVLGAAVLLFVTLILGLIALAFLLGNYILSAGWWVFIFFVVLLVVSVILALIGKNTFRIGPPSLTIETLREDVEWARMQIKRDGR